ncbi:MAG TPA: hypothetical protein VFS44_07410 [Gemmatimonadaceae bacterium]|nr:hypothetical protein [Gemmatimonadaceae bacterium]
MPSRFVRAARLAGIVRLAPLALIAALACTGDGAPAARSTPPAGAAAAPTTDAGSVAGLTPLPPDTALRQLRDFRLTLDGLQKWAHAQRALNDLTKRDSTVIHALTQGTKPRTIDEMIARIDAAPGMHDTMLRNGITAHDYVLTMLALQEGMQGYAAKRAGQLKQPLPGAVGANIDFVERNFNAVQTIIASVNPAPAAPAGPAGH